MGEFTRANYDTLGAKTGSLIMPIITLIAALANNRVIGQDNQLLWRIPEDFKHFKARTLGKPIVMGRKTFESLGRPLPERHNIVISRNTDYAPEGVTVVSALNDALAAAGDVDEVMIIGGAQIYEQFLPKAHRLMLTWVDLYPEGDAVFPECSNVDWVETERRCVDAQGDLPAYCFVDYQRRMP